MSVRKKSITSDLTKLNKMRDTDIDYSDIPPLDDSFFERATIELPIPKHSVTIRIDHNVLEWFKLQGRGYQTRINAILKAYMKAHYP